MAATPSAPEYGYYARATGDRLLRRAARDRLLRARQPEYGYYAEPRGMGCTANRPTWATTREPEFAGYGEQEPVGYYAEDPNIAYGEEMPVAGYSEPPDMRGWGEPDFARRLCARRRLTVQRRLPAADQCRGLRRARRLRRLHQPGHRQRDGNELHAAARGRPRPCRTASSRSGEQRPIFGGHSHGRRTRHQGKSPPADLRFHPREPGKQLREVEKSSILKFFVNVQNKTKLETNLQSASLLPHYNTFEARAMRVVISDLPPAFRRRSISRGEGFHRSPTTKATPMDSAGSASKAMRLRSADDSRHGRHRGAARPAGRAPQGGQGGQRRLRHLDVDEEENVDAR